MSDIDFEGLVNWIKEKKEKYNNDLLAYIKRGNEYILIAHSKNGMELIRESKNIVNEKNFIRNTDSLHYA